MMNLSKIALTLVSAIGAQGALRAISRMDLNDVLGTVGLERAPRASERALPALGLVLLGAAAGAGAALLLAPMTGETLRSRIAGGAEDAKNRLSEKLHE